MENNECDKISAKRISYNLFTIKGNFSKEFLESMGMKKIEFPLFKASQIHGIQPLEPIGLAYSEMCREDGHKSL